MQQPIQSVYLFIVLNAVDQQLPATCTRTRIITKIVVV